MSTKAQYLIDANILIRAKNDYYAFDLTPGFWEFVQLCVGSGSIRTIDRVKAEWDRGGDDLCAWVGTHFDGGVLSTNDHAVVDQFGEIVRWIYAEDRFSQYAKADFSGSADGWLVACAKAQG